MLHFHRRFSASQVTSFFGYGISGAFARLHRRSPDAAFPWSHDPATRLLPRRKRGRRTSFLLDGLAHYGMLAELIEALDTMNGGPAAVDKLYSSAETVIRMWEACEAAAANVP
jgi:hypothetical protein